MEQKVFNRPRPDATLPRNAFPRGNKLKFNFSHGMILPTLAKPCVGGSKISINLKAFCRSFPVNTSAFTSTRVYTDVYCVPLRQLFTQFGQFKTKTNDNHSTLMPSVPTSLPKLSRADLTTVLSNPNNIDDIHGYDFEDGAERICELLNTGAGYGFNYDCGDLNMLLPAAYQKICFDHYRNTMYEANDPEAYNLDQFASSGVISTAAATKMLTIRYCNYKKDYFSNIYPSLNYLASSANGMQSQWSIPSSVVGHKFFDTYYNYDVDNSSPSSTVSMNSVVQNGGQFTSNNFSVQSLRAAFALDKLVRASSYAPQHVKDQYEARYGFRPKGYSMEESYRLGSFAFDVVFNEVVSVADTYDSQNDEGQPLGNIGGKGIGGSDWQDVIDYKCEDDCIIMAVTYAIPSTSYDALGVDKFNQKFLPTDFFQPEFMDLGMQPVELKELFGSNVTALNNIILGYQPRYSEYKVGIDRNCGLFRYGNQLQAFTMHGRSNYPISGQSGLQASFFKVNPSDSDSIFVNQFNGQQANDQFFGIFEFAFACVAPMSVHGQPRL